MEINNIGNGGGGGGGGSLTVTDGITPVVNVTTIDFTSGATVTDGGAGVAEVAITGGSGSPASPNLSIQFNDTGSFGGSSTLLFDGDDTITFGTEGATASIVAPSATTPDTNGGLLTIATGIGDGTGSGGSFEIDAGMGGATGNGGAIALIAGSGASLTGVVDSAIINNPGTGYAVDDELGIDPQTGAVVKVTSVDGGGEILTFDLISGGTGYTDGTNIALIGGTGVDATVDITISDGSNRGGSIVITSGEVGVGDGDTGDIQLIVSTPGGGGNPGNIILSALPMVDPGIPGALYQTAGAVMISL